MICKKCGQQLSENALTCDACGAVVKVCQPERRRQHLLTGGLVLAGAIALGAVMGLAGKKLTPDPVESVSAETGPEASQAPTEETRTPTQEPTEQITEPTQEPAEPTQEQAQQTGSTEIVTMYLPETVTYHDESGNSAGFYIKYTYESDWKTKDYLAYDTFVCLDAGASYRMTHEVCQDMNVEVTFLDNESLAGYRTVYDQQGRMVLTAQTFTEQWQQENYFESLETVYAYDEQGRCVSETRTYIRADVSRPELAEDTEVIDTVYEDTDSGTVGKVYWRGYLVQKEVVNQRTGAVSYQYMQQDVLYKQIRLDDQNREVEIITYDPDTGEEESCQKNTWDSCGNLTQEEYYENGKLVETKVYAYKGVKVPMYLAERYPMFNRKQG